MVCKWCRRKIKIGSIPVMLTSIGKFYHWGCARKVMEKEERKKGGEKEK